MRRDAYPEGFQNLSERALEAYVTAYLEAKARGVTDIESIRELALRAYVLGAHRQPPQ